MVPSSPNRETHERPGLIGAPLEHVLEQLTLLEPDWTVVRGRRPRRDRGWVLFWTGPLRLVPECLPPPGSELIDRTTGRGRAQRRELWIRQRRRRRRAGALLKRPRASR